MLKKLGNTLLLAVFVSIYALVSPPSSAHAVPVDPICDTQSWTGEDDTAHQLPLNFSLHLGSTDYSTIFVTTNGTLTFGSPDATFGSYPNTPSVSVAGWDWVTFGQGASLSVGSWESGFCADWNVRPFPQNTGELTSIRLVVSLNQDGTWSGTVTSSGWLPQDLRRGIRFTPNENVVTISEAFTVTGGRPVEMQSCWDGSVIPLTSSCPAEPDPITCWDNLQVPWNGTCLPEPHIYCWNSTTVHYQSECPVLPPDVICWNGEVLPWNGVCQQVPPPIDCWDGTSVNWDQQCPPEPVIVVYPEEAIRLTVGEGENLHYTAPTGMRIKEILFASYGTPDSFQLSACNATSSITLVTNAVSNNVLDINADNGVFGDPCGGTYKRLSVVLSIEVDPNYVEPTPTPTPSATPEVSPQPTETPTPTYTPEPTTSPTQSPEPEPSLTQSPEPTPEPTASATPSPLPTPTPTPEPTPTDTPEPTPSPTDESTPTPTPEPTSPKPVPSQTEKPVVLPSSKPTVPQSVPSNQPSDTPIVTTDPNTSEQISNANSDGIISAEEQAQIIESLLSDGDLSTQEISNLSDTLSEDGVLSEEDKQVLADVLVTAFADAPSIPFADLVAAGLTYADLPPDQPVSLENGVILTASVADAIQLFDEPSKLVSAIFSDPGKALKAIANVGADMTPATRKKAQQAVVPAVIVTQVIAGAASLTLRKM